MGSIIPLIPLGNLETNHVHEEKLARVDQENSNKKHVWLCSVLIKDQSANPKLTPSDTLLNINGNTVFMTFVKNKPEVI